MADIDRILIVGGGIAGLSLATALHRQGYTPELVERSATWQVIGTAFTMFANGVRVLRALGIGEAVNRTATVIRRWGFFDQQGGLLCETDLEELWRDVGPSLAIARVRLHEALLTAAADVRHRLGISPTALTQDGNRVWVSFSDGTSGDYDLVVGADGIYSTVRKLAVKSSSPSYAGSMAWRSIIPTRLPEIVDNMMLLLGEGCFFGLAPMVEGHTFGFAAVGERRFHDPLAGRLERFRRRFAGFGGPVPAYLAALQRDEQFHVGPLEWVELDEWYRGRVVMIGDAAHASPPHMGEGGSMAMEDALVLADVLRREDSVERALEAYVRRRRSRVDWVQEQSRALAQAWILPPAVRNAALRERGDQMFHDRYRPLIPEP
jgi:2-polyprenyl-6-methoxyphenol hydroxylase-like FAD-dependent oxidoreductase